VGGTFNEVASCEKDVARGRHPEKPFCIVVQASVVDDTRAPIGQHTLWAYCHVPNGSDVDMTERIENQIERFAPGFRDLILARVATSTADGERHNPNYVGGDITGGAGTLRQTLLRPTARWNSYRTGTPGLYLCSASALRRRCSRNVRVRRRACGSGGSEGSPFVSIGSVVMIGAHWSLNKGT